MYHTDIWAWFDCFSLRVMHQELSTQWEGVEVSSGMKSCCRGSILMNELRLVPWSMSVLVLVGRYRKSLLCCWPFWFRVLFPPDFYHVVTWRGGFPGRQGHTLALRIRI